MACGAKFDPENPTAPQREVRCELARGHKGWHEYATTTWSNDAAAGKLPRRSSE